MNPLLVVAGIIGLLVLSSRRKAPGKRTRRNLDAFTDSRGVVHPIRGSEGYNDERERIGRIPIETGGTKPPGRPVKVSEHVKEIPIKVMGKPYISEGTLLTLGKEWHSTGDPTSASGEHRIYFNDLARWYGLDYRRRGPSFLNGKEIDQGRARKILFDLSEAKLWWNRKDGLFHIKGPTSEDARKQYLGIIASRIRAKGP